MTGRLEVCDTNVAVVANGDAPHADDECRLVCIDRLERIKREGRLALDSLGLILNEYLDQRPFGWPRGPGDHLFIWAATHQAVPAACTGVDVTAVAGPRAFAEFPDDPALAGFDRSDHVFVAVARASPEAPPVLNAVDTDWRDFQAELAAHGVSVDFLCPGAMT
jgi:hypothetical protein